MALFEQIHKDFSEATAEKNSQIGEFFTTNLMWSSFPKMP